MKANLTRGTPSLGPSAKSAGPYASSNWVSGSKLLAEMYSSYAAKTFYMPTEGTYADGEFEDLIPYSILGAALASALSLVSRLTQMCGLGRLSWEWTKSALCP